MALARVQYEQLTSGNTNFTVIMPYISKDHVFVDVDGVETVFTWLNSTTITISPAPAVGAIIDIRRETSRGTLLVNFQDASTLNASGLSLAALQVFYLAQEAFDLTSSTMAVANDGSYSASGRRLSLLGYPDSTDDAASVQYVQDVLTSSYDAFVQATAAASSASAAASSASASATSATNSANSATASATSATNSANSATAAATSATNAASSATAAAASYDSFDDRYLGVKASDPTTDNDGAALLTGALYWSSTEGAFKVWNGSIWEKFIYNPAAVDITGGSIALLTKLTVADNSLSNVARRVMRTAAATPTEADYWTKLLTFTTDTVNYKRSSFMYALRMHGAASSQTVVFTVHLNQDTAGLSFNSVIKINSASTSVSTEGVIKGFRLVGGNTNGSPVEVWLQRSGAYNHFELAEIMPGNITYWTPSYVVDSPWQAAAPTGDVVISSTWNGSGTWTPTIIGLTTAGTASYSVQVGYYQTTGSLITLTGRLAWSGHTGTGNMTLGGFPVPAASTNHSAVQIMHQGIAGTGDLVVYVGGSVSSGAFYSVTLGGAWAAVPVDTGGDIIFTITYRVD